MPKTLRLNPFLTLMSGTTSGKKETLKTLRTLKTLGTLETLGTLQTLKNNN